MTGGASSTLRRTCLIRALETRNHTREDWHPPHTDSYLRRSRPGSLRVQEYTLVTWVLLSGIHSSSYVAVRSGNTVLIWRMAFYRAILIPLRLYSTASHCIIYLPPSIETLYTKYIFVPSMPATIGRSSGREQGGWKRSRCRYWCENELVYR